MTPRRDGENLWFSVAEAARILGVNRQAIYAAINTNRLRATDEAYGRKVDVRDLIAYGIRAGKDPVNIVKKIEAEAETDWWEIVFWLLAGLGLGWLITKLLEKK
jgi:excisionase family DNA binding protein